MLRLDIVIPVLNEEETLKDKIAQLIVFLRTSDTRNIRYHIVIADNGSTDSTFIYGQQLQKQYSGEVSVLSVGQRGVGLALKAAWKASSADIVGYMDLDLATDIGHLLTVFDVFTRAEFDVVVGSRLSVGSVVLGRSLKRELTSRCFNLMLRVVFGNKFRDGMCGFKFFKRSLLDALIENGALNNGWFFCAELLIVCEWLGYRIYEIPVVWTDDNRSKVKIWKLASEYIRAMWELSKRRPR